MLKLLKKYRETISYLFFGVATTLVNWVVYTLLVNGVSLDTTASNAIAWALSVSFAFITNKLFVFESRSMAASVVMREAVSFVGSRLASGALEIIGPLVLISWGLDQALFGIEGSAAKLVVSGAVILLNYIFSKLFVFKKKKDK